MRTLRLTLALTALGAAALGAQPSAQAAAPAAAKPSVAPAALAGTYQIDATHSELSFRIRHLLGRVRGTFGEWSGTVVVDSANPSRSVVDVAIKTASIDTQNERRDGHLRSPDFFAADSFPTITFKSTGVTVQGSALRVAGDLTIRGKTKPVVLTGEFGGAFGDPQGKRRAAFTATTTINRQDFGVSWNRAVETGSMLGDDVQIELAIQAVKQ